MVAIQCIKIPGRWRLGYALDYHTIGSEFLGYDQYGHVQFETTRSAVGELLYKLKYQKDPTAVPPLVEALSSFVASWKPEVDMLVPAPPSRQRTSQPLLVLADALSQRARIPYPANVVVRKKDVPELKNIHEYDEQIKLLADAYTIDESRVQGRRILLFDDLYRSGATMNAITSALYEAGTAEVFALSITRTRSNH